MRTGWIAAIAATALLAASAPAACWTRDEAAAAGIRQLQSMLMVSALRCQAAGQGIMGDYNGFVAANAPAIRAENDRLRGHFIQAAGPVLGQRAYDSFTTSMANAYGAGAGAPASCAEAAALAREARALGGARDALLLLVARLALDGPLPDGRCAAGPALAVAAADPRPGGAAPLAAAPIVAVAYAEADPR